MSSPLWAPSVDQVARASRLRECGFDCFQSVGAPGTEELRYAEYEFQLYSLHAKWLAVVVDGVVARAPSQQVNFDLRALTAGIRLGDAWNAGWEACLDRWHKRAEDNPEPRYVCPVVIGRAKKGSEADPDEGTEPPAELDPANVWTISKKDLKHYFYARDFSGMFAIDPNDPAYQVSGNYNPPIGLFDDKGEFREEWLFEPRSFMQIHPLGNLFGVAVQPWRGCEFLPGLLGNDKARILADPQWQSLYRVIRSVSQIECDGFFDRLQGYDAVHMSLPLFHYTLNNESTNKALQTELGGLLIWIERFDPALARALAAAGLSAFKSDPGQEGREVGYKEQHWADDNGWGKSYDAASGAGCNLGARVAGCVSIGEGVVDSGADALFLRRPHFHYRVTMLMRTRPRLREAAWKLTVHRLRGLAWTRATGLPDELKDRVVLGRVLTSELSMAIALRLHIYEPNGSRVRRAIEGAWGDTRDAHPEEPAHQLQEEFEYRFCQSFFIDRLDDDASKWATPEVAGLEKLPSWPSKNISVFGSRLRQTHLTGDGTATDTDPRPARLSWAPATSPFWTSTLVGPAVFFDPVAPLDRDLDFVGDGHPAVPTRYPPVPDSEDFRPLGTHVQAPASLGAIAVRAQRVREALAIRSAAYVLINGHLQPNAQLLERRLHGDYAQFWARRHIREMQERKIATALRCGLSDVAPNPMETLWSLEGIKSGQTVRAFDWRNGMPAAGASGEIFAKTGQDGRVSSEGDRVKVADPQNFGAFVSTLQQRTFNAFVLALEKGAEVIHLDQFQVDPGSRGWTLTLGGLRQHFKRNADAAAGDLGLLIEYLAWRHATVVADKEGWFGGPFNLFRDLGFDAWVPEPIASNRAFLRQVWPAAAKDKATSKAGPLDGLALKSVDFHPNLTPSFHPILTPPIAV